MAGMAHARCLDARTHFKLAARIIAASKKVLPRKMLKILS